MSLHYLLDEHIPLWLQAELSRLEPSLRVWRVGESRAPAFGLPDPQLLEWCEANNFVLVTNNRKTMPAHLIDHLASGRHVPGIFILDFAVGARQTMENLAFVALASFENEHRDMIRHLPIN